MEHPVEPRSWLPEGAAPTVTEPTFTDEATDASGQADAVSEQDAPDGLHDVGQEQPGPEPLAPTEGALNGAQETPAKDADSLNGQVENVNGQAGPDGSAEAGPYDYRQDAVYTPPDYPSQSGYNDGVSPSISEGSPVPPYPAELPAQQPGPAATSGIAAAAYRALPKPRVKTKTRPRPRPKAGAVQARRANLIIARLEPWSVMKFSFLISLVAWVVLFVAVTLLYYTLSAFGVFAAIQRTLESVTSSQQSPGVSLATWTSASRVLGYTMLFGAVNIILITALSTIGAVIYNLVTHLGGGIEVTLKETD